ncbi:MAG TPA: hypothetical protein VLR46_14365 [Candidatus Dormibacteraeota bacterium]|nr:hypothetical protein [Candidatus Dormibacteraeota bacterium]
MKAGNKEDRPEMQAQLEFRKRPSFALIFVPLVLSLLLGGAVGYTLKAPTTVAGPSHVVYVQSLPGTGNPADSACVITDRHKAC